MLGVFDWVLSKEEVYVEVERNWKEAGSDYPNSLSCSMKLETSVVYDDNKKKIKGSLDKSSQTIKFDDLDSEKPYMVANAGETRLEKIEAAGGSTLHLIEENEFGNIFVFTLFREKIF